MLKQKFIIQRSFFEDSTKNVSARAVQEFNEFCNNIIQTIPLPSPLEFSLFKSFGIVNEALIDEDVEVDIDI
jgi:hypothetical protein